MIALVIDSIECIIYEPHIKTFNFKHDLFTEARVNWECIRSQGKQSLVLQKSIHIFLLALIYWLFKLQLQISNTFSSN